MNKKVFVLLFVVILCLVGYFIYYKNHNKTDIDIKIIDNNPNDNIDASKENLISNDVEFYHYEETISPEEDNEEESFLVFKSLYLFGDGEFYYNYADYGDSCDIWSKGKYEINGNKITLKEDIHGDCDKCFYTLNLKEHVFTFDNGSLISADNEKLTVSTSDSVPSTDGYVNCDKNIE